ncbi:MAG: transcriptional repressor [Oscillospiraceae bacterium]|nr:transcriptional repressor [Oscillospiraceae bacterium]
MYKTRQREMIINFLMNTKEKHVTANDICTYLRGSEGCSLGQATVYRHLEKMVDEGIVTKYSIENGMPACFEYTGDGHRDGICFHAHCEKCGKLFHFSCDELEQIGEHLSEHHGFRLNPLRTVFYGICEDCAKAEEE